VIVSLTSTADWATGLVYHWANILAPLRPSLKRQYTNGIFGSENQIHPPIGQWKFYWRTPGHQDYLVNHWIVPETRFAPKANTRAKETFQGNISRKSTKEGPYVFFTSQEGNHPAAVWRIADAPLPPDKPVTLDGLPLSMRDSDYWIMNCGKALIADHGDIWSERTMEMYAGLYRLAVYLKNTPQDSKLPPPP
jgi:hypothetical protein